jgi:hypothetical protein
MPPTAIRVGLTGTTKRVMLRLGSAPGAGICRPSGAGGSGGASASPRGIGPHGLLVIWEVSSWKLTFTVGCGLGGAH